MATSTDPSNLSLEDIEDLLHDRKIKLETEDLISRLPEELSIIASQIEVRHPKEILRNKQYGGAYEGIISVDKRSVFMNVQSKADSCDSTPTKRKLDLESIDWSAHHRYLTGSAASHTIEVSIRYGNMTRKTAIASEYGDPGKFISYASHGGVKAALTSLREDLGLAEGSEILLLTTLLGEHMKNCLSCDDFSEPSLKQVILEELDCERES